jgi:hypothetical protein
MAAGYVNLKGCSAEERERLFRELVRGLVTAIEPRVASSEEPLEEVAQPLNGPAPT